MPIQKPKPKNPRIVLAKPKPKQTLMPKPKPKAKLTPEQKKVNDARTAARKKMEKGVMNSIKKNSKSKTMGGNTY